MQFGVNLPNLGGAGDPRGLAELAREAEHHGWDGVFVWDALCSGHWDGVYQNEPDKRATHDPWIGLAAIALATTRVRIGPLLTPLSRRRPWKVARETVTLDHLSQGRLVLPVGLGYLGDGGMSKVGEPTDRRTRAQKLDEGLAILDGLWSGRPFAFEGIHYRLDEMTFWPPPVQSPRIPIWVVGAWPRPASMRRALRCDGILPVLMSPDGSQADMAPDDVRALRAHVAEQCGGLAGFDIVLEGSTPGEQPAEARATVRAYAEAGATWWIEDVWQNLEGPGDGVERMRARIRQGPPRG